jgi:hypothetical protein
MGDFAQACVLAGRIAAARHDDTTARQYWNQALDIVAPMLTRSVSWRLLDPAAQAWTLLGRNDDASAAMQRLRAADYHPLDPIAAALLYPENSPTSINSK